MKKLSIYSLLLSLPALFSGLSCTDLEENLVDELTKDINIAAPFPTGAPASYVYVPYYTLRYSGTANHSGYYSVQELASDEMVIPVKGNDWNFDAGMQDLHRHTYRPDNDFIRRTWQSTYFAIDDINSYLDYEQSEERIIQSRAIRAYLYWRLLDLFGNVKIVTETEPDPPQSTRQEVFDFVEQELLESLAIPAISASMDLSNSLLTDEVDAYKINRYGALGLLAKLYLNAEVYTGVPMYDKAEIAASAIIDSGLYQLCGPGCSVTNWGRRVGVPSDPRKLEGYAAVFAPNNEGNPEHIFSVNYDEVYGGGMNFSQMNLHPSSQLSWHFNQQPWNGYTTLEEFYNSYEDMDVRKEANFLVGPQLDFGGSAILDYLSDDDDIQLNYTPEINELAPNARREAGARAKKFSFQLYGRVDMNNDFPIVRLGEMYLIRAEAQARQSGNWTLAEADVNVLRDRVGVASYKGNLTEEEFLAERGREMFQELARRTDLIRFGKYNDAWWEKPASEPFRNIFPIPQEQILVDPGLTQNPGY